MIGPNQLPTALAAERRIPAWLLSLALHLAVLLAGTLLVRGTQLQADRQELPRSTSIVLARTSSFTSPVYFSDEDANSQPGGRESTGTHSAGATAADNPLTSDPPASGIALPDAAGPAVDSASLAVGPLSGGGRGKSRMRGLSDADVAAILAEDAARPRNIGPTGPTAKLSLFGSVAAEGRSFVFLIDRSQSMGHRGLGAIAAAAKELSASIDRLGSEHKFQVIAYNQKADSLGGRELLSATPENKRRLIEFVETTVAVGATEHELGLFAALRFKPEVIFLFTDGGDPELNAGQLRAIREAAGSRTAIHCLHFGAGPQAEDEHFLARLAEQNGGSYVYIDMRK